MVPPPHPPVYSSSEMRAMEERDMGGVCKGKLQRRGNQPLLCNKVDLEDLHFTVKKPNYTALPCPSLVSP